MQLVLIPTPLESKLLAPLLAPAVASCETELAVCGFGPIAAAARTAELLWRCSPSRAVLVGIAGAFDSDLTLGQAVSFSRVRCYGVGVGSGSEHQGLGELGFSQLDLGDTAQAGRSGCIQPLTPIGDELALVPGPGAVRPLLLTCCAASADLLEAEGRKRRCPTASAEDMEGFAVALAACQAGVPLTIIRGISNRVGDRQKTRWQIEPALEAAAELTRAYLQTPLTE